MSDLDPMQAMMGEPSVPDGSTYLPIICPEMPLPPFSDRPKTRMLALCSEPGCGSREVVAEFLRRSSSSGARSVRHDLAHLDPEVATKFIVRTARSLTKRHEELVVAFENIPASDESCTLRQARAFQRIRDAGITVCLSLEPEASQLLELIPECRVLTSANLLIKDVVRCRDEQVGLEVKRRTLGMFDLVRALAAASTEDLLEGRLPSSYQTELIRIMVRSLRLTLSDEDLRIRLCMLLLGSGSVSEVEKAIGPVSDELLERMRVYAPQFGLDASLQSFSSLMSDIVEIGPAALRVLSSACELFPNVVSGAIRVLLERDSFDRVTCLAGLPGVSGAADHIVRFGPSLLDTGGSALVVDALESYPRADAQSGVLSAAVSAFRGELPDDAPNLRLLAGGAAQREALLFVRARAILRAGQSESAFRDDGEWSDLGRRLLVHCEVWRHLVRGELGPAMRLLVANPCDERVSTVSEALLTLDLEIARLLLCDGQGDDPGRLERAERLLRSDASRGFAGYAECAAALRAMLRPGTGEADAEGCVLRAERSSDALTRVVALISGCVLDLRSGSYVRASVRSMLASALAGSAGLTYLSRVSSLLGGVARFLAGDLSGPERRGTCRDDLGAVQRFVDCVAIEGLGPTVVEDELGERVPRDAMWLICVLCEGMGAFSELVERALPHSWATALSAARLSAARSGRRPAATAGDARGASREAGGEPADGAPIRVSLLGGFRISVRGTQIVDGRIGHRSAKAMLTYLMLQHNATALRSQVVDQLWPECDYVMGANRVYQATSALRAAIADLDPDLDPFILGRSTRSIAVDTSIMSCDVEEFCSCAKEAADGADDGEVLEKARRVEKIYAGDLYVPSADCTGLVALKREEFKMLYADAMVSGADAALRLKRVRTAARLAANALSVDDMREDAVIALVSALRASGRDAEADRRYKRYARRLSLTMGRLPSWRLRQVMRGADALEEASE